MGKSRSKKLKSKPIPSVVPDLKCREDDIKDCKVQSSIESAVNSLLDQLQVPDSEDNLCGLRRLSELFFADDKTVTDDPNQTISRELHTKFIKTVAPFLVDNRPDIRNAAAGALRNVSVAGGPDICDVMVSNDILTPLIALIQQYATDQMVVSTNEELSEEQKLIVKEKCDTLLQAVHLLWNLCESNETAVKYFNSSNLLGVLLKFMDISFGRIDLTVVIAQCLHTVSDDNKVVLSTLESCEEDIVKLIMIQNDEPSYIHLRTLAAGLLYNIHGCVPVKYLNVIFEILFKVIAIDSRNELCNLSSDVPLDKEAMLSSDAVTKLEKLLIIIEAQITAFEILTNICSDEEDDCMETESWNDSDEVDDEDNNAECINPEDNGCSSLSYHPSSINSHTHEALVKLPFLQNSFSKTNLPANVIDILTNHTDTKNVMKKFQRLRSRAYHFLNNLITVLDADDLDSPDNLFKMWSEIGRMIINGCGDTEIVEASTASLRAVLKKLVSIQYPGLSQMTSSDLEVIFKIVEHCKDNNVCANVVQVVGALGVFCASRDLHDLLKDIGKFILCIAEHQGPLWLTAEALDALMDVFAEDNTDKVTEEIGLVSRLSVIAPIFKRKVRAERKTLGDHYALVTTANNNLARFITYKKNRLKCIQNGSGK